MNSTAPALEQITRVSACVRRLIEDWDPADLSRIESIPLSLESSVIDMRVLQGTLLEGAAATGELGAGIIELKRNIARMIRLVDAGAAFYRGLGVRLGSCTSSYTATGRAPMETSLGSRGLQA